MNRPLHAIGPNIGRGMSTQRLAGIGFVVLLHVAAIWALVNGMVPGIRLKPVQDIVYTPIPKIVEHPPLPQPPTPQIPQPSEPTARAPDVPIQGDTDHAINVDHTQAPPHDPTALPPADTSAAGIASTHTTPDYPPLARKMGEQGRVQLRLSVSVQGAVTAAEIVRSSGYADLDQSAVDWVIAHWRYKPAVRGGTAVAGTTQAVVVFNLTNVR